VDRIPVFEPCIGEDTVKHVLDEFIASRRTVCKAYNGAFTRNVEMSTFYEPDNAAGLRWDDAEINFAWPDRTRCMAEKDRSHPGFVK
jgi:hypothetical protein